MDLYFDFGNHTEKVHLRWKKIMVGNIYQDLSRVVLETPKLRLVPHIGYVSLFPFMGRIIPADSWILEKQLDLISNRTILWTNFGLRSLARTRNVVRNYQKTGFFWQRFDQRNGKGKGARVFTGWTSLILLIMAEAYP
ncbi:putative glycosidase [Rosa chinensis]|uniref:Putative glycosidase n=1 Tax=Rosa chinensis TaxID=74649 RepID=A0A2P6PBQ5_ROSCH|nr:putative glycosidase [Rosa chinensis]